MKAGTLGEEQDPWAGEMFRTLRTIKPRIHSGQLAFDTWLSQRQAREAARSDRDPRSSRRDPDTAVGGGGLHLAAHFAVHALLRRQRGAGGRAGLLMGTVVSVITSMLLLLTLLNDRF